MHNFLKIVGITAALSVAIGLAGCKFKGNVEVNPEASRYISVSDCQDETPTIDCRIQNISQVTIGLGAIKIRCINGKGESLSTELSTDRMEAGQVIRRASCPSNNDVKKILFYR